MQGRACPRVLAAAFAGLGLVLSVAGAAVAQSEEADAQPVGATPKAPAASPAGAVEAAEVAGDASSGEGAAGEEPPEYRATLAEAVHAFQAGSLGKAKEAFLRAHQIYPNARTLRGLGVVEFELGNHGPAAALLRQALESGVKPLGGALREETTALLSKAEGFVAHYTFVLSPWPDQAELRLDAIPRTDLRGRSVLLEAGEHLLEVEAPKYARVRKTFHVAGGVDQRMVIQMQPLQLAVASAPPQVAGGGAAHGVATGASHSAPASAESQGGSGSFWTSPWTWVGVGVVVVGGALITAAVLKGQGNDDDDDAHGGQHAQGHNGAVVLAW